MDMETATHRFREDRRANKAANDAKRLIEGVDAVSVQFLRTFAWRRLRFSTLRRFGSRCMCCGAAPKDGAVMNVDHIKSRKEYPHLALDPENVQVLCGDCNHGKGNSAPVDFRPTEKQ
jgi:5-methylcytosine-specific restriction endonuclease McrA